ncbi:BQ5605_C019g08946 [Microbotryum silenes-dioicae]|uniref:BQ5605_C019g08946 protein n=1 Tax=Microbotryum silenes-dioicae TaxID=796604 RepID=A0A2X0M061_9BASI|nr:BQ5605_C019g08946 [Microbotryum silenes-dioicae]
MSSFGHDGLTFRGEPKQFHPDRRGPARFDLMLVTKEGNASSPPAIVQASLGEYAQQTRFTGIDIPDDGDPDLVQILCALGDFADQDSQGLVAPPLGGGFVIDCAWGGGQFRWIWPCIEVCFVKGVVDDRGVGANLVREGLDRFDNLLDLERRGWRWLRVGG